MTYHDQAGFDVRCEWGANGLEALAPSDITIIVDVLSFTTSVNIAVSRGVTVFPFPPDGDEPSEYAQKRGATLAARRSNERGVLSLAPSSLVNAPSGARLVLPSPNGSTLSFKAANSGSAVVAGCLRNASAVARWAASKSTTISVIPAGERWPDRTLRPSFEDLIGAGAIIDQLPGMRSPEAEAAVAAFRNASPDLEARLRSCASGRELIERGYAEDVQLAGQLDIGNVVPVLEGYAFLAQAP